MMSKPTHAAPVTVTSDGKLRVPAYTAIYFPDEPAEPGKIMGSHYNHTVTVKVKRVIEIEASATVLAVWGAPGKSRAVRISSEQRSVLGL